MRLISCYAAGYGSLKNNVLSFQKGLNPYQGENGTGKTTLTSFIKAMFYGLETQKKNGKFSEREHYCPFDGGVFGGNVVFEHNGATYRIERSFDKKSESKDTVNVYKNDRRTDEFNGLDLGVTFFGVDKGSFERTVFVTADDVNVSATSDIKTKLGAAIQGGDGDTSYENAIDLIDASIKRFKLSKYYKTSSALITVESDKLNALKLKIENTLKLQEALEEKYKQETQLDEDIRKLNSMLDTERDKETQKAQRDAYDRRLFEIKKATELKEELEKNYPNGIPNADEIKEVGDLLTEKTRLDAQKNATVFTVEDREKLTHLREKFANGTVSEQAMAETDKSIDELKKKEDERNRLTQYTPGAEEQVILNRFALRCPTAEEITLADEAFLEYDTVNKQYNATPQFIQTGSPTVTVARISSIPYVISALIAILTVGIGIALILASKVGLGIALTVVGGLLLLITGFMYLNKKTSIREVSVVSAENPERTKLAALLREKENALSALLLPYGYNTENGLTYALKIFKDDLEKYHGYLLARKKLNEELSALNTSIELIKSGFDSFFSSYGYSGSDHTELSTQLKLDTRAYLDLTEREKHAAETANAHADSIAKLEKQIDSFIQRYALSELNTNRLLLDLRKLTELTEEIEEKLRDAENYRIEHGISPDYSPTNGQPPVDTEQLNESVNEKRRELAILRKHIEDDENETEKLDRYRAELIESKILLAEYEKKHELLTAAKSYLTEASDALNNRYVKPVLDEFLLNSDKLGNAIGKDLTINRDFQLFFEENGALRSEKHLSAGQRTLCALCFRISLIKNLYRDSAPFVILDDPFATLDEANMERARSLVSMLAEEMQILYFTCHGSRSITAQNG